MVGLILLEAAAAAGLRLSVQGDRLLVRGPRRAEALARRILAHKPEVMATLTRPAAAGLTPEEQEAWEERAAIREFDGGLPREHAEALALADVLKRMGFAGALDGEGRPMMQDGNGEG
jgi:hypothetical protein